MKKISLTLLLIICIAHAFANVQISGKIKNNSKESILITSPLLAENIKIQVNDDGSFSSELKIEKSLFVHLKYYRYSQIIYLENTKDLHIKFNEKNFYESISFEGTASDVNTYLLEDKKIYTKYASNANFRKIYSKEYDSFSLFVEEGKTKRLKQLNTFKKEYKNKDFFRLQKERIQVDYLTSKLLYKGYYLYVTKDSSLVLPKDYYNFIEKIDFNNAIYTHIPEGFDFLKSVATHKLTNENTSDSEKTQLLFDFAKNEVKNTLVKDYLLYSNIFNTVKYSGPDNIDSTILNNTIALIVSSKKKEELNQQLSKWNNIKKGMSAPDFSAKDSLGKLHHLSDYKGNYVYIDVWATWCSPCRGEIPFLKELEHEMHGKNIIFMSVSVDKDENKWKKMLSSKQMGGVQLIADGAWNSTIIKAYKIGGIPRFILIDKEGKIINASAKRPSGNIKEVLNNLEGI